MNGSKDVQLEGYGDENLDRSLQGPLSLLFVCSALWLVVSSLLGAVAFWQLKFPGFIDFQAGIQTPYVGWFFDFIHQALNYGRAVAATKSVMIYGWLLQGFLGVAIWLTGRLTKKMICKTGNYFLLGAIALWNIGVLVGLMGVFSGEASGFSGFDFPKYAAAILFTAYAFIGLGMGMRFAKKSCSVPTPSEWYLIGAIFWFPWFFGVAYYFVFCKVVFGVMPALVHAWYIGGLEVLVLGSLAISILYYLVPSILGLALNRVHSAKSAFWFFAFLGAWSGVRHLVGGPLPAWMISSSVVAGVLLLIPGTIIANNQMVPLWSNWCKVKSTPVLWYLATGGVSLLVWISLEAMMSLRGVSAALRFSYFEMGVSAVFEYAFLSMVLFGSIYAILPTLTGKELPCCVKCCSKCQFWWGFCGVITFFTGTFFAGTFMGLGINFAPMAFVATTNLASPFFWLSVAGGIMVLLANLIFVKNVVATVLSACCESNKEGCCS